MGKYKKGILGYFRGKVGTVIGSIWKGINYMRSLPDVSNTEPTPAQLNVRLRFALVVGFLSFLKGTIKVGYQKFVKGITPFNAATSYHLKYAVSGTSPNYLVDYNKVILSVGDLEEVPNFGITAQPDDELKVEWEANGNMEYGAQTDTVTIIVFSESLYKFVKVTNVVARSALTFIMPMPAEFSGTTVHCWLMLTDITGKQVSNSQHMGPLLLM